MKRCVKVGIPAHLLSRCVARIVLCIAALIMLPHVIALGNEREREPAQRVLTLREKVHFAGEVERVLVLVASHGELLDSKHVAWIQQPETQDVSCIARVTIPDEASVLQLLFVVFGQRGEVRSVFKTLEAGAISTTEQLSLAELQDRLVEQRGVLRRLLQEVQSQGERLRVLQEDADAIANVSKIVSTEDELQDMQEKIRGVDTGFSNIRRRVELMKARPQPLNALKRESELVRQLTLLSTTLASAEERALKGIGTASAELRHKLQMIEDASDEHVVLLEEELAELQRRRRK